MAHIERGIAQLVDALQGRCQRFELASPNLQCKTGVGRKLPLSMINKKVGKQFSNLVWFHILKLGNTRRSAPTDVEKSANEVWLGEPLESVQ